MSRRVENPVPLQISSEKAQYFCNTKLKAILKSQKLSSVRVISLVALTFVCDGLGWLW